MLGMEDVLCNVTRDVLGVEVSGGSSEAEWYSMLQLRGVAREREDEEYRRHTTVFLWFAERFCSRQAFSVPESRAEGARVVDLV